MLRAALASSAPFGRKYCFASTRPLKSIISRPVASTGSQRYQKRSMASPVAFKETHADTPYVAGKVPGTRFSAWSQEELTPRFPALRGDDITCEVCIVGGGIAGLATAYRLVKEGKSVVVLEARAVGAGMTGRTTAHIMQWNDDYYQEIESMFGKEKTAVVAKGHTEAVDWIGQVAQEEGIDCEFKVVPGYLFPHDDKHMTQRTLEKELAACQRAGMEGVQMVDLSGEDGTGRLGQAVLFPHCANFHPLKFVQGLADAVVKHGGRIFEETRAKSGPANGKVETMEGPTVVASEAVVLATLCPTNRNLAVHTRYECDRSYVVALEVPKDTIKEAQFWDTQEPYHYIRTASNPADKSGKTELLVIGGEDHQNGQAPSKYPEGQEDPWTTLEAYARERWPQCGNLVYKWTGMVLEPYDLLGMYGKDPIDFNDPPVYIITGHSGQGMTGAAIGSGVVVDQILGRDNPGIEVYNPNRVKLGATPGLIHDGAVTASSFASLVLPRTAEDLKGAVLPKSAGDILAKGEGQVVQEGARKVAMFRDESGTLHRKSAVCTHLGCLVEWNPKDKTFDCPCHGSLFDTSGRCICGPAVADLEDLGDE